MLLNDARKGFLKQYVLLAAVYLLFAAVFFWPIFNGRIPGTGGDSYQSAWELWWVSYAVFVLHTSPYFTNYVFYPAGASLITQTMAPIAGIISAPLEALGSAAALNFTFIIGFMLSGVFAYALIFYITGNKLASFLGGFVFAFSPIHVVQALGHLQYTNTEFIPLFLLFFMKLVNEKKQKYAAYAAISFVLITFMGDIEQALMTIVLIFFILVYMLLRKSERQKIMNARFLGLMAELVALVAIIGSPAFVTMVTHINNETLANVNAQAGIRYNELYSPDLVSFFTPSLDNGLLHSIPASNIAIYKGDPAETTAYAGYVVMIVAAYALYVDYKKERLAKTGMFAFALLFMLWLAIGPYLWIDGSLTGIPGIYLLYSKIPFFNVLREPGRFDVVAELLLAVLFAYGLVEIQKNAGKYAKYVMPVAFLLLLVEYFAMPTSQSMVNSEFSSAHIPAAYYELGSLHANPTVLLLPASTNYENGTEPNLYPGMALYYQTAFKKPMIGGYTTRTNVSQLYSVMNIPLVVSAYYLETGQGLVYASPIVENYTNATKFLLAAYNVTFVGIIRQAYTTGEFENLSSYLYSMFGAPISSSNTTQIFSTVQSLRNFSGTTVAYTPVLVGSIASVWQPGWLICHGSITCNETFANMWWGANPAFIEIYAPKNEKLSISMRAMSYGTFSREDLYFDGVLADQLGLITQPKTITINVTAVPGINPLVFVPATNYQNIGIENFTFSLVNRTASHSS
ncbi:MAG: hypothetical protein ACP5T3_01795 [Candidatus Micrarchaeia archaeon]